MFTLDLARVLHTPLDQVHPNLREEMTQHQPLDDGVPKDFEVDLYDTDDEDL
jgi:hypothetical protein